MADFLLTVGVDTEASYDEFQKGIANLVKRINDNPPKVKLDFGVDDGGKALSSLLKEISESASAAVRPLHDISKAVSEINNKNFDMNLSFNDADTGAQALGTYVERVRDYVRELREAYGALSQITKTGAWSSGSNSDDQRMLAAAIQDAQRYDSVLKKLEDRLNRVSSFAGAERVAKDAQVYWNNMIPILDRAKELNAIKQSSTYGVFPEIPKESVDTASRFADILGLLRDGANGEAKSVDTLNEEYNKHSENVNAAAEAEKRKLQNSSSLTSALKQEEDALNDATDAAQRHSDNVNDAAADGINARRDLLRQVALAVDGASSLNGGNYMAAISRTSIGQSANGINEFNNSLNILRELLNATDRQIANWDTGLNAVGVTADDVARHIHVVVTGIATMRQELNEINNVTGNVSANDLMSLSTTMHGRLDENNTLIGTQAREQLENYMRGIDSIIADMNQRGGTLANTIENMTNLPPGAEYFLTWFENARSALIAFDNARSMDHNVSLERDRELLANYKLAVDKNTEAEKKWAHVSRSRNQSSRDAVENVRQAFTALQEARNGYDGTAESARRLDSATKLYNKTLADTNVVLRTNGEMALKLTDRLRQAASRFGIYLSTYRAFYAVVRVIRQMINASKELDSAMAQMQIVTRASNREMNDFADSAAKAAQRIGSSVTDFIDSATTFARLGYNTNESSVLAEYTAMLQNVGDIDVQDAQNAITAIVKAFDVDVSDIESIMDKLVTTGNNFPISVSQIAEGMNNASSALAAAGNTFEQSVALLTAANTTIQNASKSSTGLRTIAARLRNTKNELDELGESFESDAKYEELVNGLTKANVTLKTATGEFRSTYDIIADIARVWDHLTSMEQAGLATAISGTRQQAVFFSLVEQFKEASGAMDEMSNSAGALTDAYGVYMDTVEAHVNQFKAAFEGLSKTVVYKEFLIDILDIGKALISVIESVAKFIDIIGGLKVVLAGSFISIMVRLLPTISLFAKQMIQVAGAFIYAKGSIAAFSKSLTVLGIGAGPVAANIMLVVAAVGALVSVFSAAKKKYDEAHPSLEKLKQDYEEQKGKLEELRSKLSENEDRIKELNKLNENGGLNIVEQDELDRLTEENDLLEHQILLQQEQVDTANKLAAAKAKASAEEYLSNDQPFEYYTGDGHGGAYENHRTNKGAGAVLNLLDDYNRTKDVEEQSRILSRLADEREELLKLRNDLMLDEEGNAEQISGVDELIDKIDLLTDRAGVFNRVFNRFFKDGGFTDEKVKEFTEYLERIGYDTQHISKESLIEYFDGVGRASEGSAESLKDTVDQLEKLADVEKNFDSISGAISDYEKNGFVSAQKFQSLEEVYGSTDGWEEFKRVLSDTKSTIDDVRAASNKLAENWVNSNGKIRDALNGVTEENADATKAMLENMGIVNAEALVEQTLTAKRLEAQAASMGLTDATWEEVSAKLAAAGASKDALGALEAYRKQQVSAKLATMDFTTATKDSISALYAQAAAANASQRALGAIRSVQAIKDSTAGLDRKSSAYGNAMRAMAQYQNIVKEEFSAAIPDTIVAPKVVIPSSGGGSSSKGGSSASKELELYVAEIERYREELEKLSRIRIHKEDLNLAIEEEKDLEKKVNLYHAILTAYSEEQKSLERLQALRRKDISSGVADLRGMGFSVEYSAKNDELFIRNKEHINELYGKNTEETNELRKAAEALIKDLEDLNKENQEGTDTWQELGKAANSAKVAMIDTLKEIVTNASGAVDAIQNVYSTLHKAADEFAANGGFISVDTFQEIIGLGAQYMQYLTDENGLLVINEDSINKVIAAKTEELALDTAMSYVERLRLAMQDDSVESLNELLYATQDTANATWDLVYANLKMLGLNDQQYAAALHNINGIRAMARAAINGVGHVAGEALEELKNMEKGTGDILKYVMDMLKQRIQDEIDALEDLKDQFGDLIDLKKESLKATKEESDYQKKVAQRIKEIAKLQAQIDALSLDNSRESQARRAKLLEELAQMQEDLDNEQTEHAISAQEESLDKMKEMYDAEKDEEIKTLEDTISSYQKLYDMAIDYIESHWDTLYNELIDWNTEYGLILAHQYRKVLHKITRICWNPLKPCTTTSE